MVKLVRLEILLIYSRTRIVFSTRWLEMQDWLTEMETDIYLRRLSNHSRLLVMSHITVLRKNSRVLLNSSYSRPAGVYHRTLKITDILRSPAAGRQNFVSSINSKILITHSIMQNFALDTFAELCVKYFQ